MILDNICFGSSFFQMAMLLRRSLLLNGCLFNSSVWHNLSKNDVKDLSRIDRTFFSRLTTISKNSPEEFHYLEFGETDIDTEIKVRRLQYFEKIMKRKNTLPFSVLMTQILNPCPGDWILQINQDIKDLGLPVKHQYYETVSMTRFKEILKDP